MHIKSCSRMPRLSNRLSTCQPNRYTPKRYKASHDLSGGMEGGSLFKLGTDSHYPEVMLTLLARHGDFNDFDKVLVTGNEEVLDNLAPRLTAINPKFAFTLLPHAEFLKAIAHSSLILTAPGLETALETFASARRLSSCRHQTIPNISISISCGERMRFVCLSHFCRLLSSARLPQQCQDVFCGLSQTTATFRA